MGAAEERWLIIPRWEEFQHPDAARSQVPPWIKDYTKQLSDDAYLNLTFHQRGILHGLRLEYARSTRQLAGSTSALSRRLGQRITDKDLAALQNAGLITFTASKPASTPASRVARPEKRREERTTRTRANTPSAYTCTICDRDYKTPDDLAAHNLRLHDD